MKNNTQMFKAFKLLNKEKHNNFFVHGKDDISQQSLKRYIRLLENVLRNISRKKEFLLNISVSQNP